MSLLRRIVVAAGLLGGVALPNAADAGLIVTASGVTMPTGGILGVPDGGFVITSVTGFQGFIDFALESGDTEPTAFKFDYSLVDLRPGGGYDVIFSGLDIGGNGITIDPGQTFRYLTGSSGISHVRLNSIVDPGQTELKLALVVTGLREVPIPAPVPEPATIALACSGLPLGVGLAWRRKRKAA